MSKQEIYAWSSLASSLAIVGFYAITVFGWPETLPDYSDRLTSLFIKVFLIAFVAEFVLDLMSSKAGVHEDERDINYASKGFRNAYYFLMVAIAGILGSLFLPLFISEQFFEQEVFFNDTVLIFHFLFLTLLVGSMIKRSTQVFYYRKDA